MAAAIALPSFAIAVYAWTTRDSERITAFALAVAEPLALLAALAVTGLAAYRTARRAARPTRWGVLLGSIAAAGMLAAALWVDDMDGWTVAALGLLPLAGMTGARLGVYDELES